MTFVTERETGMRRGVELRKHESVVVGKACRDVVIAATPTMPPPRDTNTNPFSFPTITTAGPPAVASTSTMKIGIGGNAFGCIGGTNSNEIARNEPRPIGGVVFGRGDAAQQQRGGTNSITITGSNSGGVGMQRGGGAGRGGGAELLSDDRLSELKEAFDMFDINQRGYIDGRELKAALRGLGYRVDQDKVNLMLAQTIGGVQQQHKSSSKTGLSVCSGGGGSVYGQIGFDEFVNVLTNEMASRDTKEEIRKVFDLFDVNHNGSRITICCC
eukprot:GHVS01069674.1.p1 GENE.GHVS01069674.1~~GHVS01069674.1.p1  ORF type:complete len:271 (-),score=72.45 GHVS01069674.1:1027-1839(-)